MTAAGPRVRFAPSPTGSLHLGNARTALFNWLVARREGGTLVLRIEDTDVERQRRGAEQAILEDLRWLGLDWDEGPDVGGPRAPYRQSERGDTHRELARRLIAAGHAYRCFCTDAELEAERQAARSEGRTPRYAGRCAALDAEAAERRAAAGEPFAVRFRVRGPDPAAAPRTVRFEDRLRGPLSVDAGEIGDWILIRRDGRATYNFAVVADDAAMGIDLVLRGDDHLSNTPRQVLVYEALGQAPPRFAHLPMVRGADGARLSKRHGAESVAEFRRRGFPREGLLNALLLLGWAPRGDRSVLGLEEMVREFDLGRINRSAAAFDPDRLRWLSGQHLQRKTGAELAHDVGERLRAAGLVPAASGPGLDGWLSGVAEMVKHSVDHLDQVPERCAGLFARGGAPRDDPGRAALAGEGARAVVAALVETTADASPGDAESWKALKAEIQRASGVRGKALFQPLRVALTGAPSGPELDRLVPLIAEGHRLLPAAVPALVERARRTLEWMR